MLDHLQPPRWSVMTNLLYLHHLRLKGTSNKSEWQCTWLDLCRGWHLRDRASMQMLRPDAKRMQPRRKKSKACTSYQPLKIEIACKTSASFSGLSVEMMGRMACKQPHPKQRTSQNRKIWLLPRSGRMKYSKDRSNHVWSHVWAAKPALGSTQTLPNSIKNQDNENQS